MSPAASAGGTASGARAARRARARPLRACGPRRPRLQALPLLLAAALLPGCSRTTSPREAASAAGLADTPHVLPEEETYFTDLPGVAGFDALSPETQGSVTARANRAKCECGCAGHSVNACLHMPEECEIARRTARAFVLDASLGEDVAEGRPFTSPAEGTTRVVPGLTEAAGEAVPTGPDATAAPAGGSAPLIATPAPLTPEEEAEVRRAEAEEAAALAGTAPDGGTADAGAPAEIGATAGVGPAAATAAPPSILLPPLATAPQPSGTVLVAPSNPAPAFATAPGMTGPTAPAATGPGGFLAPLRRTRTAPLSPAPPGTVTPLAPAAGGAVGGISPLAGGGVSPVSPPPPVAPGAGGLTPPSTAPGSVLQPIAPLAPGGISPLPVPGPAPLPTAPAGTVP